MVSLQHEKCVKFYSVATPGQHIGVGLGHYFLSEVLLRVVDNQGVKTILPSRSPVAAACTASLI